MTLIYKLTFHLQLKLGMHFVKIPAKCSSDPPPIRRSCRPHSVTNPALYPAPLPAEIISLIAEHVSTRDDEDDVDPAARLGDLARCCRTSRAFLNAARPRLYETVYLDIGQSGTFRWKNLCWPDGSWTEQDVLKIKPRKLVSALAFAPSWTTLVRKIQIKFHQSAVQALEVPTNLLGLLARICPRLDQISLYRSNCLAGDFTPAESRALENSLHTISNLRVLTKLNFYYTSQVNPAARQLVVRILQASPRLTSLALSFDSAEEDTSCIYDPPLDMELRSLLYHDRGGGGSLFRYITSNSRKSLRHLEVYALDVTLSEYSIELLENLESALIYTCYSNRVVKSFEAAALRTILSTLPHVQSIDIDPDIGASTFFDGVLDFLPVEIKHARIPYPPLEVLLAFLESSANARLESLQLFATKAGSVSGINPAPECLSFQYSPFSVQAVRKAAKQRGLEIVEAGALIGFRWEEDICTFITPSLCPQSAQITAHRRGNNLLRPVMLSSLVVLPGPFTSSR